ncbi:hypothetical protein SAMN05878281_2838 [Salegentibacter salegens]|uniref:Uncharacterized protein n=1 Tax=Salegentibacter salegens TaxID=143223 RepID=A0A1M7N2H2_9FLAO|nr:hypothetical protein LY58_01497 [Salegentibacter salegens]SHM97723.1 hypothetical protein SAMN05878281_2838 [Salegentibacter salegens]
MCRGISHSVITKGCCKLADGENFSFDLSQEEIEEATRSREPELPKLP